MRVRLSYSVELEDVPESVAQLIEDEAGQLSYCDHAIDEINNLLREADPPVESALKKIDKVRQVLGSIDRLPHLQKRMIIIDPTLCRQNTLKTCNLMESKNNVLLS